MKRRSFLNLRFRSRNGKILGQCANSMDYGGESGDAIFLSFFAHLLVYCRHIYIFYD